MQNESPAIVVPKTPEANNNQKSQAPAKNGHAASKTIRVSIERLDILMNLFEELVIDRGRLQSIATEVNHSELNETVERMSRTMGDLQNIVLTMRMIPIDTVFNRFPKMVRTLSRDLKKKLILKFLGQKLSLIERLSMKLVIH